MGGGDRGSGNRWEGEHMGRYGKGRGSHGKGEGSTWEGGGEGMGRGRGRDGKRGGEVMGRHGKGKTWETRVKSQLSVPETTLLEL